MFSWNVGGSASVVQIGAHYNGSDFYGSAHRFLNWQTWKKLWHNGNFDPNNVTVTETDTFATVTGRGFNLLSVHFLEVIMNLETELAV